MWHWYAVVLSLWSLFIKSFSFSLSASVHFQHSAELIRLLSGSNLNYTLQVTAAILHFLSYKIKPWCVLHNLDGHGIQAFPYLMLLLLLLVPQANNVPTNRNFNVYFSMTVVFWIQQPTCCRDKSQNNDYMIVWDLSLVDFVV